MFLFAYIRLFFISEVIFKAILWQLVLSILGQLVLAILFLIVFLLNFLQKA
jgi:hypothetical protein